MKLLDLSTEKRVLEHFVVNFSEILFEGVLFQCADNCVQRVHFTFNDDLAVNVEDSVVNRDR